MMIRITIVQPATATVTRTCVRQITLYLVVTHEHGSIENENAATMATSA